MHMHDVYILHLYVQVTHETCGHMKGWCSFTWINSYCIIYIVIELHPGPQQKKTKGHLTYVYVHPSRSISPKVLLEEESLLRRKKRCENRMKVMENDARTRRNAHVMMII